LDPPIVLVTWVKALVVVLKRKTSVLPSAFPGPPGAGTRSAFDSKAIIVPAALIFALVLNRPAGVFVIWVRRPVLLAKRKISELPSGFVPKGSLVDSKTIKPPFPLTAGLSELPARVAVTWVIGQGTWAMEPETHAPVSPSAKRTANKISFFLNMAFLLSGL
jgi:hypothetical protein